jgi:hypothetical protein
MPVDEAGHEMANWKRHERRPWYTDPAQPRASALGKIPKISGRFSGLRFRAASFGGLIGAASHI